MSELLNLTIKAHGGTKRWNELKTCSAQLHNGGGLWALKDQPEFASPSIITIDLHKQHASHHPFLLNPNQRTFMEPNRAAIETLDGKVIEERMNPRDSFKGHTLETAWDKTQVAYFAGYAMWTYLTLPFCIGMAGVESKEIGEWNENGEILRRLQVKFPSYIATHSSLQTLYIGKDGLFRRHDYDVDISTATAAHYVTNYKEFDGIMVPTTRRVYVRGEDNKPLPEPLVVSIDLSEIHFK